MMLLLEKNKTHNLERIYLNKESVDEMENMILIGRHLERYALIRQFVWGSVLDIASGVGYGSYLLAKNPDVKHVHGVDCDPEPIEWAKENFTDDRVSFSVGQVETVAGQYDFLVSLETIEHLDDPETLYEMAMRCNVKELIISFPHKKTTHYNKYHKWDILADDVIAIFKDFACINQIRHYDSTMVHMIRCHRDVVAPKLFR